MNKLSRRSFIVGGAATVVGLGAVGLFGNKIANADVHHMDAKWIWPNDTTPERNSYAEFQSSFTCNGNKNVTLEISCNSMYAVYLNEAKDPNFFAQMSDFPIKEQYYKSEFKLYDKIDISKLCKNGTNQIKVLVWNNPGGGGCQSYLDGPAGLIYQIKQNGSLIDCSSENIQSRLLKNYQIGDDVTMKVITGQMGFSFHYYANKDAGTFANSKVFDLTNTFHQREILPLELGEAKKMETVKFNDDTNSLLIGFDNNTVGFLDVKFNNPVKQRITIAYGEHIHDHEGKVINHVRQDVGGRHFSVDIDADAGDVVYLNPFRRLGAKYLEVFVSKLDGGPEPVPIKANMVDHITLRPVNYPLTVKPYDAIKDTQLKDIYSACILTLRNSMHEHYEDCPWREQCLYGMDSRNQMLCGYYAFEGHEYQRHNLILLANSLRDDGLIEICSPCNNKFPIPMFSYAFIMGLCEYVEYTKDKSILKEVDFAVDAIMKKSADIIEKQGQLAAFNRPPFWNFYEWWPNGGSDEGKPGDFDLNLNTIFVIAHEMLNKMDGRTYTNIDKLRKNLDDLLYDSEKGEYKLSDKREQTSHLGNATAILAGLPHADKTLADKIAADMPKKRESETAPGMVRASLSMKAFVYDALLSFNDADLKNEVLADIRYFWGELMMGSPYWSGTFWEDEEGQAAFSDAGSLCHGWSAIPVYYIWKYFI